MAWVDVKSKGLLNIPGFPEISNDLWGRTRDRLKKRQNEFQPAIDGLTRRYTFTGEKRVSRPGIGYSQREMSLPPGTFGWEPFPWRIRSSS